jgi:hypothetical protein
VLLTALGVLYPEEREPLFDLAAKLNYSRTFPYWFVRSILEDEKGG